MATRILVLDIDDETLIALQQILEDEGFDTTTTWNVSEARQLLHDNYFDFLIVRHHPPDVDAVTILREVQGQNCCGAYVVLAASAPSRVEYQSILETVKNHLASISHHPEGSAVCSVSR